MKVGNRGQRGVKFNVVLASIVMGFTLAGCAGKSSKDQLSWDGSDGRRGGKPLEHVLAENERGAGGQWSHDAVTGEELDQFVNGGPGGRSGKGAGRKGLSGSYDREDALAGNEWERALLPGMNPDEFSPEQLAERVAAAREHAMNVARESEDPALYAAVTGGRDLYQDLATEYALSPERLRQLQADYAANPDRNYERRGFFDEESYAFGEGLSPAERIAARVEAARRRAGLGETTEEMVTAFASGAYSRVYERDDDPNASSMLAGGAQDADRLGVDGQVRGGKIVSRRGRDGAVDIAMADADVKEDVIPQTLNGALPMILGVDEHGQFQFDEYKLQDEVKLRLDELAVKLQDAEYDQLDVYGYTDRIGEAGYNKSLSRKRALAVAQYLRDKGVPEYKIKVRGLGQENPVTRFEDCEGLRGQDKITCLQPDRRVEIAAYIRRLNVDLQ